MTQALVEILKEVDQLSAIEKAELADRLAESLGSDIPEEIENEQIAIVRKRIAEVESGSVELISGEEAFKQVQRIICEAQ